MDLGQYSVSVPELFAAPVPAIAILQFDVIRISAKTLIGGKDRL